MTESRRPEPLPVDEALPRLAGALLRGGNAVLRAPAGAGKTTRVPPAILDLGLAGEGQVVVLEPRRVAARAAARRIAWERGVRVGDEVGYAVRFDRKTGPRTRIVAVTDGVLLRRLQEDPFLEGVGAVVFDEFHERSLAADLALAMCRRVQREARSDLRIVAMSATIDAGPVAEFLGAEVVESAGFLHPVEVRHLERPETRRVEDVVADGVRRALAATTGDVLVFLPGVGEIRRVEERIADDARRGGVMVLMLFGDMEPEQQDYALQRQQRRRVVLATNVAETSVTVDGVTAVVDSGLARVMRYDPSVGMDRLVLERIARPSIVQRTGRAGRVAPGVCFRLWTRNEERAFPDELPPEVRRVDVAGAVLELLAWGEKDIAAFPWFQAPEPARIAAAVDLLTRLDAVRDGRITETGEAMARLPTEPRLARIVVEGHRLGVLHAAVQAAAVIAEPPRRRGPRRTAEHRSRSDVVDRFGGDEVEGQPLEGYREQIAADLERNAVDVLGPTRERRDDDYWGPVLRVIFAGYADRLARRRSSADRRGVLVSGRGVRLADESAVGDAELFVAVEIDASSGPDALVRCASEVRREWLAPERIRTSVEVEFDEFAERVAAVRRTRYDELVLDEAAAALPDDGSVERLLAEAAATRLDRALDLASPEVAQLRARVAFLRAALPDLGVPALDDDAVRAALPDLCAGRRSFDELRRAPLADVLRARLERRHLAALDRDAPERIAVPSGSHVTLRYEEGRAPVLAVRIQEIFGWRDTPRVAGGRVKVLLHLLAPNHRPQQVTDDLASFWTNTYPEVRKELKRRYPKHAWPEDPWTARAEKKPQRRK